MTSEISRERSAFYHVANRAQTRADQRIYNTTINSSGIDDAVVQAYRSVLPFEGLKADVDTWIAANSGVIEKHDNVALTELLGSNGQTWYIEKDGERVRTFIAEQFLVDLSNNTVPNAYVFELYRGDGTRIPPATYDWWVIPDEGLIRFEEGATPADLGIGTPSATVYSGLLDTAAITGGGGGDPLVIGDPLTDGTWIIIRDVNDNLDSYPTDIPTSNNGSLEFLRFENGTYKRKVTMSDCVHTNKFAVETEGGGYLLPMGEYNTPVRALRKTSSALGDVIVSGSYAAISFASTNAINSFYAGAPEETFQKTHVKGPNTTWDFYPASTEYSFPIAARPINRSITTFGLYTDLPDVRYRAVATYADNGAILYENVSRYEFFHGGGHDNSADYTTADITFVRFTDPVAVESNRAVVLTIHTDSPIRIRYWAGAAQPEDALHYIFTDAETLVQKFVTLDFYDEGYVGETIKVGKKFHDYEGVICIREHIGVFPMNIYDGNWSRVGDSRFFAHIGTDDERYNRLVKTYKSPGFTEINPPVATQVFATTSLDEDHDIERMFSEEYRDHIGADTNGWLSASFKPPALIPQHIAPRITYCEFNPAEDHLINLATPQSVVEYQDLMQSVITVGTINVDTVATTYTGLLNAAIDPFILWGLTGAWGVDGKDLWAGVRPADGDWEALDIPTMLTEISACTVAITGVLLVFDPQVANDQEFEQVEGLRQAIAAIRNDTQYDDLTVNIRCSNVHLFSTNGATIPHANIGDPESLMECLVPIHMEGLIDTFVSDFTVDVSTAGYNATSQTLRTMEARENPRAGFTGTVSPPFENLVVLGSTGNNIAIPAANISATDVGDLLGRYGPDQEGNGGIGGFGSPGIGPPDMGSLDPMEWLNDVWAQSQIEWLVPEYQPPSDTLLPQRVWIDLGVSTQIGALSYNNYHDAGGNVARGIKGVNVYVSKYKPTDSWQPGDTNLVLLYSGEFELHEPIDDLQTKIISLPKFTDTFRFVTIDVLSNWGDDEYVGFRHLTIGSGTSSVTTVKPDTIAEIFEPVWGDSGNGEGIVIETVNPVVDETHGPTEWAEAEKEGWSTFHSETLQAISDNGNYLLFDPWPDRDGHRDWITCTNLNQDTLHLTGSRIALATQQGNDLDTVDELDGSLLVFSEWVTDLPIVTVTEFPLNTPLNMATGVTSSEAIKVRDSQIIGIPSTVPSNDSVRIFHIIIDRDAVHYFKVATTGSSFDGGPNSEAVSFYVSINNGSNWKWLDIPFLTGSTTDYLSFSIGYNRLGASGETMVIGGTNYAIQGQRVYDLFIESESGSSSTLQFTFERLINK